MIQLFNDNGLSQKLAIVDLTKPEGPEIFHSLGPADVIYSDPPWSPGNEKWWRRYAKVSPPLAYTNLLMAWCKCVTGCLANDVFVEQSIIDSHRKMLTDVIKTTSSWRLGNVLEQWVTRYGSPKRDNVLMHFGTKPLQVDPTGLSGVTMTKTVILALGLSHGSIIGDPCTGLGMTSRIAHMAGCNFIGTELNADRLNKTIAWLKKHGYRQ